MALTAFSLFFLINRNGDAGSDDEEEEQSQEAEKDEDEDDEKDEDDEEEKATDAPAAKGNQIDLSDYMNRAKYPISVLDQYWLLQKREFTVALRLKTEIFMKLVQCSILAFLLCSLFFQLSFTPVRCCFLPPFLPPLPPIFCLTHTFSIYRMIPTNDRVCFSSPLCIFPSVHLQASRQRFRTEKSSISKGNISTSAWFRTPSQR